MAEEMRDPKPAQWAYDFVKHSQHWMVAMLFWKQRHSNPDLAITLTKADVDGFQQSLAYNKQEPIVIVDVRRPFMPGDKVPKDAVESAEDVLKTYLAIRLVDKVTTDPIVINENNEADLEKGEKAKQLRRIAEMAHVLVTRLQSEDAAGVASRQSINDVCTAFLDLARAYTQS